MIKLLIKKKVLLLLTFIISVLLISIFGLILPTRIEIYMHNAIREVRYHDVTHIQSETRDPNNESVDSILGEEWSRMTSYRIRNSQICSRNLTFIVVVHSAVWNFNKRRGIRETWAKPANYKVFTMKTVFFLGSTKDPNLQSMVDEENAQFQDIVQGEFLDTYRNMTYKAVMVFKWVTEFCNQAELVIKVDDDVFINILKVLNVHLPNMKRNSRQLLCEVVHNGRVMRKKSEKWALAPNELPGTKFYPTYCRGYFVLLRPSLVKVLLQNVPLYPFFWIDDVYLFGMVAEFAKVQFTDDTKFIAFNTDSCAFSFNVDKQRGPADCCVNIIDAQQMGHIWTAALRKNNGKYLESIVTNYSRNSWLSDY